MYYEGILKKQQKKIKQKFPNSKQIQPKLMMLKIKVYNLNDKNIFISI